jgi:hypothetical protein
VDKILDILLTWQVLVMCLGSYGITWALRTLIVGLFPQVVGKRVWEKVFVPLGPLANGMALAVVLPLPPEVGTVLASKLVLGLICGLFSAAVYARFRDFAREKAGVVLPEAPKES